MYKLLKVSRSQLYADGMPVWYFHTFVAQLRPLGRLWLWRIKPWLQVRKLWQ